MLYEIPENKNENKPPDFDADLNFSMQYAHEIISRLRCCNFTLKWFQMLIANSFAAEC